MRKARRTTPQRLRHLRAHCHAIFSLVGCCSSCPVKAWKVSYAHKADGATPCSKFNFWARCKTVASAQNFLAKAKARSGSAACAFWSLRSQGKSDTQHRKYLDLCVAGQTRLPTLQISPSEKQLAPFVAQICSTQRCVVAPDAFAAAPRATPCCSLATMLSVYSHLPLDPLASSMKSQQS